MDPPVLKNTKNKTVGRENTLGGILRLQKPAQRGGLPRNTIPQQPFAQQLLLSSEIGQLLSGIAKISKISRKTSD